MAFKYVFFDWNGTLAYKSGVPKEEKRRVMIEAMVDAVNSVPGCGRGTDVEEVQLTAEEFGGEYQKWRKHFAEQAAPAGSYCLPDVLRATWKELGLSFSEEEEQQLMNRFFSTTQLKKKGLYPGVQALLAAVHASGLRMGLIRNSKTPKHQMVARMETYGIAEFFSVIIMSGEVGFKKPSREVFEAAVAAAGLEEVQQSSPKQIIYIGNESAKDVVGANGMGWTSVLVRHTEESSGGRAVHEIDELDQLLAILGISS